MRTTTVLREMDFGVCDECGSYVPDLSHVGGEWRCGACLKSLSSP